MMFSFWEYFKFRAVQCEGEDVSDTFMALICMFVQFYKITQQLYCLVYIILDFCTLLK